MYNLFKGLAIIIFMLTLVSCKGKTEEQKQHEESVKSEFNIECVRVGDLHRCENQEVICYSDYGVESLSLQCKFKGER